MQLFFRAFSVLSHPVFVPLYAVLLLQYANPYLFGVWLSTDYFFIVGTILFNAMFFPLVTLALMRALGFIEGYSLESRYERIIVLMAVCVYYIWTFNVFIRHRIPRNTERPNARCQHWRIDSIGRTFGTSAA
jgi:hypothetical protein